MNGDKVRAGQLRVFCGGGPMAGKLVMVVGRRRNTTFMHNRREPVWDYLEAWDGGKVQYATQSYLIIHTEAVEEADGD